MKQTRVWPSMFAAIMLVLGAAPVVGWAADQDGLAAAPAGRVEPLSLWYVGQLDTPGDAQGVAVAGEYAYIADGASGLRVVDVSDPAAPAEVGAIDTGTAFDVAVVGDYAYVADWSALRVVDVSSPTVPVEVGHCTLPGWWAVGVAVAGNYAYVADDQAGLRVVNVSNPAAPFEMGFLDTLGLGEDVALAGAYAYLADEGDGLRVVNVSNPGAPTEEGFYDTPDKARGVAVAGNYAYVADFGAGLRMVDVSDPATPVLAGLYDTSGQAFGVAVDGGYVYVADYSGGLVILRTGFSISGWVTDAGGVPVADVTITATGGLTAVTDAAGAYAFSDLMPGTYTLTASKEGYNFAPASLEVTLPPDAIDQDFVGTALTYSISGQVVDAEDNPIVGVTISATGGHTAVTVGSGEYTFSGLPAGSYTLTPAKEGYSFAPESRSVTLPPGAANQDFVGKPPVTLFLPVVVRNH